MKEKVDYFEMLLNAICFDEESGSLHECRFLRSKRVRELDARAAGRSKFKVAHTLRKTGLSFNCLRLIAKATIVALAN